TRVTLSPLTQHDTRHYLLQRSSHDAEGTGMFSRQASRDLQGATLGVPRAIEARADESARRAARAEATTISPEHVRSAVQSLRSRRAAPSAAGSAPAGAPTPGATQGRIPSRAERANP